MNFSYPFIRRPIGTTLLAIGVFLVGVVAYLSLPVASLPTVDIPTIFVQASEPGADPATMAATVAAPLERHLSEIGGVTEITSKNTLGSTGIVVQFDVDRNIDGAARDVQAALNAAVTDLPSLPQAPSFRKFNPAAAPILSLALTSQTIAPSELYDIADTVIAQRISQVDGVGQVSVTGAEQPAIRVRVDPVALAAMGLGLEDVRNAIVNSNPAGPTGMFDGPRRTETIATNDQLRTALDYDPIVVRAANGTIVRLSDVASVRQGVRNTLSAAWFNRDPSVLVYVTKQANANVIDTVNRVRRVLTDLGHWVPADINIEVVADQTRTIRASIREMQIMLGLSLVLVMAVVFVFLRRAAPMLAAGVAVPVTLAGTCAAMWAAGFSVDNLSLMALVISIGFVVDDAIVMIENVFRNVEAGKSPRRATLEGARQIGFTVISINISLIAVFIPVLFMGGIVGRFMRELSVTIVFAVAVSTIVSLSVIPMICAHFVRAAPSANATRLDRIVDAVVSSVIRLYARTLRVVLNHRMIVLMVMLAICAVTVGLYIKIPKGFVPQDDTGLVVGTTEASPDVSFKAMSELQQRIAAIVMSDPAVAAVASSVGGGGTAVNQGRLYISLKPLQERQPILEVIDRLRGELAPVTGIRAFLFAVGDFRVGGRQSKARYQFTLWSPDIDDLQAWVPRIVDRLKQVPALADVSTDRELGGLQANVVIDRAAAARLCVQIRDIDNAINDAFAQRPVSTIYTQRNQYWVVIEIDPRLQQDPSDLERIYVTASNSRAGSPGCAGTAGNTTVVQGGSAVIANTALSTSIAKYQVPLSAVARFDKSNVPLVVNHQGQFPAITITYNLNAGTDLQGAAAEIRQAIADIHLPDTIHAEAAGDARAFAQSAVSEPVLLVAALIAVYIVLGVLYESLAHPLTIISTLPSSGLGALLALELAGRDLNLVGFIGILLLMGIVKKNGIMLVDFALEAERRRRLAPAEAIFEACIERFRPIVMTTVASLLSAIPLAFATGYGAEIRRPLGITIIGGLVVSQILTLYTTPVIYLLLHRLHRRLADIASGSPSK